jgi:hypothetical protein
MRGHFVALFAILLCVSPARAQEGPHRCLAHTFVELSRGMFAPDPRSAPIRHVSDCKPDYSECTFKILQNRKEARAEAEAAIKRGVSFAKQCLDKFFPKPPKHDPAPNALIVWSYEHFPYDGSKVYLCSIGSITNYQTFNANNPDQVEWWFRIGC